MRIGIDETVSLTWLKSSQCDREPTKESTAVED